MQGHCSGRPMDAPLMISDIVLRALHCRRQWLVCQKAIAVKRRQDWASLVRLYDEHPAASNGHVNSIRINNCHPASDRRPRWRRVGRLRAVHARTCLAWCSGTCAVYALIVDNSAATFLRDWYRPCAVAPRLLQRRPRWPPGGDTGWYHCKKSCTWRRDSCSTWNYATIPPFGSCIGFLSSNKSSTNCLLVHKALVVTLWTCYGAL